MSNLNALHFQDPEKARVYLEAQVWPNGRVCPHCGVVGEHYSLNGKTNRAGLYKCSDCREPFTVTVGTVFERSKIGLHIWLQAVYLINSSKKGISAKQLERTLKVTYKTAWFMSHRIREAMTKKHTGKLGGPNKIVEVDETYQGKKTGVKKVRVGGAGASDKRAIVSLVERNGEVRSFHVTAVNHANLKEIMFGQIDERSHLMTDEATRYWKLGKEFAQHSSVNHSNKEYVRGEVTTNTVESYFSLLKRGIYGTFHSVSEQHLQRYVNEFDFRYNNRQVRVLAKAGKNKWTMVGPNDTERTNAALKGISGKRLTYRRIGA
jgi:transposase-like protein